MKIKINLRKELKDNKRIKTCTDKFGVTGDETRLKICYLLCHYPKLSVSQMADILNAPISTVSHSLNKLKTIHVVGNRRRAKQVLYFLSQNRFAAMVKDQLLGL